jgi:hypothetical protein
MAEEADGGLEYRPDDEVIEVRKADSWAGELELSPI